MREAWWRRAFGVGAFALVAACSDRTPAGDATGQDTSPTIGATSSHDWTRFGWNAARTNAATDSTGIDSANVATLVRQQVALDGTVDASPIYLHGIQVNGAAHDVFVVTTTYGKTLAIDARTGSILWRFTPPGYSDFAGSFQITTATPVADPSRLFVYAAAPDGNIRKLSVADGSVVWATPITQLPTREKIASALNYDRGHVIGTTGGYIGDAPPYQGHVAVIDGASGQVVGIWNAHCSDRNAIIAPTSCSQSGSAIWGRAGAVVDGATGDLFVATGNGQWDGATQWGDAVVELDPTASRVVGNFTPTNTADLNSADIDVGSTSPVLLAAGLIAQSGKDGRIRVLDLAAIRVAGAHQGGERQNIGGPSGSAVFTAPAVWQAGGTTWLFGADGGGTAAWTLSGSQLQPSWSNRTPGTSPVVAGGLLFVFHPAGGGLVVYNPESGHEIARLDAGRGHWNSPIVVDGMIALPEGNANDHATTGTLNIYHMP